MAAVFKSEVTLNFLFILFQRPSYPALGLRPGWLGLRSQVCDLTLGKTRLADARATCWCHVLTQQAKIIKIPTRFPPKLFLGKISGKVIGYAMVRYMFRANGRSKFPRKLFVIKHLLNGFGKDLLARL